MKVFATLFLLVASPAAAQVGVGTSLGPDAFIQGERKAHESGPVLPLALATSLAFDATTWSAVAASTVPAKDLTLLIRRGYYKLELLQAVLLASKAGAKLKDVTAEHDKGKTLRELSNERHVDFDALYDEALRLDARVVEELLPSVMRVSVSKPEAAAPSRAPRRRKRVPGVNP